MSTDHVSSSDVAFVADEWISQAEAANIRGVTRQAIARLVKKGRFSTLSIGGKTLLKRSEVEEFVPHRPGPIRKKRHSARRRP